MYLDIWYLIYDMWCVYIHMYIYIYIDISWYMMYVYIYIITKSMTFSMVFAIAKELKIGWAAGSLGSSAKNHMAVSKDVWNNDSCSKSIDTLRQSNMAIENILYRGDFPIDTPNFEWISNSHVWLPEGNGSNTMIMKQYSKTKNNGEMKQ